MDDNYENNYAEEDAASTKKSMLEKKWEGIKSEQEQKIKKFFMIKVLPWIIAACAIIFLIAFLITMVSAVLGFDSMSGGLYSGISYAYENCESIKVEGHDGLLSLEDYVMGVVSDEAYANQGMEALKAQAVAARTYAIIRTNYCQNTIKNSSQDQNFTTNVNDRARQAVLETQGLVLTYDGSLFSTEYDSFYKGGDFSCNSETCSVTYSKKPNGETHVVEVPSSWKNMMSGGHGRGMSQIASYHLASIGYEFDEILEYFYSDGVELSRLEPITSGIIGSNYAPFYIRTQKPKSSDIYFKEPYVRNSNRGQCVWYVKGRASEIIDTAVSDEEIKQLALSALNSTAGNGKDWWNNPSLSVFGASNDYREPQIGSIIVWEYTSKRIAEKDGHNYGHVAIIENITLDGKVSISEGWATNTKSCPHSWGCVQFNYRTFNSIDEYYNWVLNYDGNDGYNFLGYVYLLG